MQPLTPIDRLAAPASVRPRSSTGDAFAALLGGLGEDGGEGEAARQAAAPGGKRLPVAAIDPASLLALPVPPLPAPTVDARPIAPPPPEPAGTHAPVPVAAPVPPVPIDVPVAGDIAAPSPVAPSPPEGSGKVTAEAPAASPMDAPAPAPAVRRPMPGETLAPVVVLAPPRPPEPVAVPVATEGDGEDADARPAIERAREMQAVPAAEPAPRPVAAPVAADTARLDLRDDRWMQGMIDRIETLHDESGGTAATRIRLSPDALGTVEILLHETDDGMQVRFASDHADAARLLADAQPRLADLAQQRGVRLGGMQVDVGGQRDPSRHGEQQPGPRPARSVPAGAMPADSQPDDIRIA